MTHPDPTDAALRDERAIREVITRYAVALDQRDWERVASCFAPDASIRGTAFEGARDDFLAWLHGAFEAYGQTMHMLGTQSLRVEADECAATTYCHAFHTAREGGEDLIVGVRYVDRLARCADDGWTIIERAVEPMWVRRSAGS